MNFQHVLARIRTHDFAAGKFLMGELNEKPVNINNKSLFAILNKK
jgi:hypothetical protein